MKESQGRECPRHGSRRSWHKGAETAFDVLLHAHKLLKGARVTSKLRIIHEMGDDETLARSLDH